MTEAALRQILDKLIELPSETECIEFKEAKNTYDFAKLGKYFSALANEANLKGKKSAWLIFGVKDKPIPRTIVGSSYRANRSDLDSLKAEIANKTTNRITFTEIYEIVYPAGRVLMFEIPAAPIGFPIAWEGHYYGRDGEDIGPLNLVEIEQIRSQATRIDWSAQLIERASIEDLDENAILAARENYKTKFPRLANEVDSWDTKTFLNKAKITISGKITNTAIVLLGKSESEHYISPAQARLTWILKDYKGEEIDYEHFDCPLLLSVNQLFAKIRNLKYRYIKDKTLFPTEIEMYDPYVIRESLHNCIAHQDYTLAGKVIVVEFPKRLVFSNEGFFMPENVLEVLERDSPDSYSRNKFLTNAMFNLNMIDTIGSGIKRMFQKQKERYFPLPEYHLKASTVSLTIYGQILSQEYAQYVSNHPKLSLNEVIVLDKVQKNKTLSAEEIDFLNRIGFSLQNTEIVHNGESEQISDKMKQFLTFCKQARSKSELLHFLGLKNHSYNYQNHIEPFIHKNWIERTNKDNPKDRNQKYILTSIGRKLIGNGDG